MLKCRNGKTQTLTHQHFNTSTRQHITMKQIILIVIGLTVIQCNQKSVVNATSPTTAPQAVEKVQVGAEQFGLYVPKLKNKNVALVVNHTSVVGRTHLVDTLKSLGISIRKAFAPEHGF